jgi:hypothetical protein
VDEDVLAVPIPIETLPEWEQEAVRNLVIAELRKVPKRGVQAYIQKRIKEVERHDRTERGSE